MASTKRHLRMMPWTHSVKRSTGPSMSPVGDRETSLSCGPDRDDTGVLGPGLPTLYDDGVQRATDL